MEKNIKDVNFVPKDNWLNKTTYEMFNKLSFNGYFLAGNSVANMIEGIELQGDLDFWITEEEYILPTLNEFLTYYEYADMYYSMLKLYSNDKELPEINLIYTNLENPISVIACFDFDYCRCLYSPKNKMGLIYTESCIQSIKTKEIHTPRNVINKRILKAIKYGYSFNQQFWSRNMDLLVIKFGDDFEIKNQKNHKNDFKKLL